MVILTTFRVRAICVRPTAFGNVPLFAADNVYVGDQYAAAEVEMLVAYYNISAILNVAWDLDIRYNASSYRGDLYRYDERLMVEYSKVRPCELTPAS